MIAQPAVLATGPAKLAAPVVTLAEPSARPAATAELLHGLYWLTVTPTDEAPLVLVVDDAHWADEPSLQALAYLARRVEELPVAIMLAARSELAANVPDIIRDDHTTVVLRPSPLTRAAGERLVRAALGDPTPTFLSAYVGEVSGGGSAEAQAALTVADNACDTLGKSHEQA